MTLDPDQAIASSKTWMVARFGSVLTDLVEDIIRIAILALVAGITLREVVL
jgi:hypothetical protein